MYSSTFSFTSSLNGVGGQRHAPTNLPAGKRLHTPCAGDWVGPSSGLDVCGKSRHRRDSIPGSPSPLQGALLITLCRPTYVRRTTQKANKLITTNGKSKR